MLRQTRRQDLALFIQMARIDAPNEPADRPFWTHFSYLFTPREWQTTRAYLPSKWNRTAAMVKRIDASGQPVE